MRVSSAANAATFRLERPEGFVELTVAPRRLTFTMTEAPPTSFIIEVIAEARAAGLLASDDFSALVDMRAFTGAIDWQIIPQIQHVMPQGDTHTNKNAYVVRDAIFDLLSKVNAALFPDTTHATFRTIEEARHWLGWD